MVPSTATLATLPSCYCTKTVSGEPAQSGTACACFVPGIRHAVDNLGDEFIYGYLEHRVVLTEAQCLSARGAMGGRSNQYQLCAPQSEPGKGSNVLTSPRLAREGCSSADELGVEVIVCTYVIRERLGE